MSVDWKQADRFLVGEAWIGTQIDNHINKLCLDIGPRWSSSLEEKKACDYIIEQMKINGLSNPRADEFELDTWSHDQGKACVVGESKEITVLPLLNCPEVDVVGCIVDVGFGMKHEIDGARTYLKDAVAVLNAGHEPFSIPIPLPERIRMLADAGAAVAMVVEQKSGGRMEYRHATDKRWSEVSGSVLPHPVPTVLISREDGARLRAQEGKTIAVRVRTKSYKSRGYNTLADISGEFHPEEWILLGAHHDTVIDSPGGNDNASGTAVLLECARLLSSLADQLDIRPGCNIRFATWGAEEQTHQGSASYVQRYNGMQSNLRLALNLDELAAGPIKGVVLQFPHLRSLVQEILDSLGDGLRCHVMEHIDSSGDSFSFARQAIPTGMLWRWRFVGRHPDADFHHEPGDTADKVRSRELREYAWQLARLLLRLSHVTSKDWPSNPLNAEEVRARIRQEVGTVGRVM